MASVLSERDRRRIVEHVKMVFDFQRKMVNYAMPRYRDLETDRKALKTKRFFERYYRRKRELLGPDAQM